MRTSKVVPPLPVVTASPRRPPPRSKRQRLPRNPKRPPPGADGHAGTHPDRHPGADRDPDACPHGTPAPTPVDRTAGFPHEIEASKLAGYGFAVTSTETVEYQYTGWQNIDGATYYYDPATHQPVTGNPGHPGQRLHLWWPTVR